MTNVQCYHYQAYGHYQNRCPQRNDPQMDDDRKRKGKHHAYATNLNEPSHKRTPRKIYFDDECSFYFDFIDSIASHDEI